MPTPVIMPKFEMTQETGKVLAWLKHEGEHVSKGDPLLEVETDKVNQEVEAPASGILAAISAQPGQVVPIATPIAYILKPGETLGALIGSIQPAPQPAPQLDTQEAARTDSSIVTEGHVRATPLALRLAEDRGVDLNQLVGTGPLGRITKEDVEASLAKAQTETGQIVWEGKVLAVPAARRLAREHGVDLRTVRGTGPGGRVQPADVERQFATLQARVHVPSPDAVAAERPQAPALTAPPAQQAPASLSEVQFPEIAVRRVVELTNIRRTIGERMTASVREAPQFSVSSDVDLGRALLILDDLKVTGEGMPKITLTALIVKACGWALRQHPEVNASFQSGVIVEWDEVNVGVATAIEQGLIVPVVRGADELGLRGIAAHIGDLTGRARDSKLKMDDLLGGTFTVSNLGMFGIDRFEAILNPPQAAILAVGRMAKRAIVGVDDKIEIRPMATLTLTADHRVLDGATAARFLATLQRVLEHPGILME